LVVGRYQPWLTARNGHPGHFAQIAAPSPTKLVFCSRFRRQRKCCSTHQDNRNSFSLFSVVLPISVQIQLTRAATPPNSAEMHRKHLKLRSTPCISIFTAAQAQKG
jgi:hypothetical protein